MKTDKETILAIKNIDDTNEPYGWMEDGSFHQMENFGVKQWQASKRGLALRELFKSYNFDKGDVNGTHVYGCDLKVDDIVWMVDAGVLPSKNIKVVLRSHYGIKGHKTYRGWNNALSALMDYDIQSAGNGNLRQFRRVEYLPFGHWREGEFNDRKWARMNTLELLV